MQKILVLFNLRDGVDPAEYERWARETDLPTARGLAAVNSFEVFRSGGHMRTGEPGPYQYVEWLEISDAAELGANVEASPAMQAVVKAFGEFADAPQFILMDDIEAET